jgi:hypothetical protein
VVACIVRIRQSCSLLVVACIVRIRQSCSLLVVACIVRVRQACSLLGVACIVRFRQSCSLLGVACIVRIRQACSLLGQDLKEGGHSKAWTEIERQYYMQEKYRYPSDSPSRIPHSLDYWVSDGGETDSLTQRSSSTLQKHVLFLLLTLISGRG